jgi:uncharacterized membrane protein
MTLKRTKAQTGHFEPRWPVVLAIVAVVSLLALLPARMRILPTWVPYAVGITELVPVVAVAFTAAKARWLRIERTVTLLFFVLVAALTLANLLNLIRAMVYRSAEVKGLQLLGSSVGVWVVNVFMFSLLYWQIDRGGPEARRTIASAGDVSPDWKPSFVDYLFLSYATATAFSTTDVLPLTPRAKMLMMLESTIALVTLVVVAARSINILG